MSDIYFMCKYTPVELIRGFGREAKRLEAVMDSFETADAAAHPNICGYGKVLLEACMRDEVREVVLVNCCDVARRVYDILKQEGGLDFLYLLDLPHHRGKAEAWLFESRLRQFISAYEAYSGIPFDVKKAAAALREQAGAHPGLTDASAQPGSEGSCSISENASGDIEGEAGVGQHVRGAGTYISLQGAHGGPFLHDFIQSHFDLPVVDDTCSGNRVVGDVACANPEKEFLPAYAEKLLCQLPCLRMMDVDERQSIGADAAGVVYHTMKFCDYYGFEYANRAASANEQPVLKIETDATRQSAGQLATRLDAFSERLGATRAAGTKDEEGDMKPYVAGIDSGSSSTDVVILDREANLVAWEIQKTGAGAAAGAERALEAALEKAHISRDEIGCVISTGYGRGAIGIGDDAITEITCHARGAHFLDPSVRTIVDIGGQDSKVIRVDETGGVENFVMNDKCAAGTGRFLEMMGRTLEMSMEELEARGHEWKNDVAISSMCTVFAESEVVSLVAQNTDVSDIIHGLNVAVATKTAALAKRVKGEGPYMMTGGVAKNGGVVAELEKKLGAKITVSEHAQLCGAIGAALFAL